MTIEFGDWQLRKRDENNWELYHRHETRATKLSVENGTVGQMRWHGTGHFYQERTFANALEYAADWEMRNKVEATADFKGYAAMLGDTLERFRTDFARSIQAN